MDRAVRFYAERPALNVGEGQLTFRELNHRVESLAAALTRRGFRTGDRLALLLPNGPEYVELAYACSRVGIIIVPINTRLSVVEIDRVLADASS
jgi:acyl-CoA synthetase (AMP-forming)/AMP-acid ligase II